MTKEELATIVRERLYEWGQKCLDSHATPAFMLCIGHDHDKGDIHVFVPDLAPPSPICYKDMAQMLRCVADQMEKE